MHCERMKHQKARKYGHRHWHKEGNSAGKLGAKTMSKQILHMYSINVSCCSIYSIMGVELDKVVMVDIHSFFSHWAYSSHHGYEFNGRCVAYVSLSC
jgi:hypothetical protein